MKPGFFSTLLWELLMMGANRPECEALTEDLDRINPDRLVEKLVEMNSFLVRTARA